MPSTKHVAGLDIFHYRPELAAELLSSGFGFSVPAYTDARVESIDVTQAARDDYPAHGVVVYRTTDPVLAVLVEIQLNEDPIKTWSWPLHLATAHSRYQCPVVLLVICPIPSVAARYRQPIDIGHPGLVLRPLVADAGSVPMITDPQDAITNPELAVLSAMTHGAGEHGARVLQAMLAALAPIEDRRAKAYTDLVRAVLHRSDRFVLAELRRTFHADSADDLLS